MSLGDQTLIDAIKGSNVYCFWSKGHVMVHVSFRNSSPEHVTLSVEPHYKVKRGAWHGSGLTNWQSIGINGGAFRAVFIDAGAPDGVPKNWPIAICNPDLSDIESG
jgi:hypothetical protein